MINTVKIFVGLLVFGAVGFGYYAYFYQNDVSQQIIQKEGQMMEKKEEEAMSEGVMKKEDAMMEGQSEDGSMMKKDEGSMEGKGSMKETSFSGTVLAGTSAPLLDFKKADYDKAVASGKLVLLYFYAEWCPICRAEFPKMQAAFDTLKTDQVIAFRVNYKDSNTDVAETDLAKQFGVAYQHTKVFVKSGKMISKHPDSWEQSRYISEINNLLK